MLCAAALFTIRIVHVVFILCAPGEASEGSTVPHPEEPGRIGGVLRTSLEGSLPLGCPSEPTTHG